MELTRASREWASRPADERYSSLEALHAACVLSKSRARTAIVPYSKLQVTLDNDGQPALVGTTGATARFTNWSFGQLCSRLNAPASYLRRLPPDIAKNCINAGIAMLATGGSPIYTPNALPSETDNPANTKLLLDVNGDRTVRAFTSERYTRIWHPDITARLLRLVELHPEWQPAPAAQDGSRGLYKGDRDLFAFLVDNDRRVFEKDKNGGLGRGFFVWNSEVGSATFGMTTFLYNFVCANHIVWGASSVKEVRLRHIGNADDRAFSALAAELREYADSSVSEDEAKIVRAKTVELGKTKDEVLDKLFGLRIPVLSRTRIEDAYVLAEQHEDWYGSPRSVWGMVSGLTESAKAIPYADDRVDLERAASKVMALAS